MKGSLITVAALLGIGGLVYLMYRSLNPKGAPVDPITAARTQMVNAARGEWS